MQSIQPKRKNKRATIIVILATLALLVGVVALVYSQKWWPFNGPGNFIIDGVNYGPPTEEEIQNSQNAKKDIIEEEDESNDSTDGLKTVNIGVSYSEVNNGNVEVRAFVSGVIEGTGACTATLTKAGAQTVTKSVEAFVDASTSQCKPIFIPVSEFDQSGEWILVVSYKSPTSSGESEEITITI